MASIVMADDGIVFDGRTPETRPLGGAEASFVALAEALAARGHDIAVFNRCATPLVHNRVRWTPLAQGAPAAADLYIANRGHRLIGLVPDAKRCVFWIHNPGQYLKKPRYVWALWRRRPVIVSLGEYNARTIPAWMPDGGRAVIPYGLPEALRHAAPLAEAPPPRAIFTSNPLRGLDWLLDLWAKRIRPAVPSAELHIYAGAGVYGAVGDRKAAAMEAVLARADALHGQGVRRFSPLPRAELIQALRDARVMLYRGDASETFCMAVGEAQAVGLPAVVQPIGALPERIIGGVTGEVAPDEASFAAAAIKILTEDKVWRRMHEAALLRQRGLSWNDVARRFEALLA